MHLPLSLNFVAVLCGNTHTYTHTHTHKAKLKVCSLKVIAIKVITVLRDKLQTPYSIPILFLESNIPLILWLISFILKFLDNINNNLLFSTSNYVCWLNIRQNINRARIYFFIVQFVILIHENPVELNSLLPKFFCYITWLLYQLIRRNSGRLANKPLRQILLFL